MLFADEERNAAARAIISTAVSRFHKWPFSNTVNLNIGISIHDTSLTSVAERLFSTSITGVPWLEFTSFGMTIDVTVCFCKSTIFVTCYSKTTNFSGLLFCIF